MKIWVIGRNYPLPENNMQGSFELEQAKMLSRSGCSVHYLACSLHPTKRIGAKGIRSWNEDGVEITVLSAFFAPRVYPFYFVGGRNRKWKELFDAVEKKHGLPDVIHLHYPAMLMLADALAPFRGKGIRIVATEHWTKVLSRKLDGAEQKEFRKYKDVLDEIICVGAPLKEAVRDLTGMEGVVVPNIVNGLFRPSGNTHKGFRFVAAGRLVKVKQFDKIIEVFSDVFAGKTDVTLTILGGGEEKEELRKLVESGKAGAQITLAGSRDREATAGIVSESDCLVCFSRLETFGVPIIEGWACGLPVIASTAAAVTDRFDERLGVEVPYDDPASLAEAMRTVYDRRDSYDKAFISNYAQTHYSEKVIFEKLLGIYEE